MTTRPSTKRLGAATAAAAALTLSLAACGGGGSADASGGETEEVTLRVASYGGPYQEAQAQAFFDPYVEQNPHVTIVQDSPSDNAKLRAMVESGNPEWDLVVLANDFGNEAQGEWLEEIDYSVVDRDALIDGYADTYRVGADVEGTVIAYNTERFDQAPGSFADLFDIEKYPGKRAFNSFVAGGALEAALLADGVPAEQLYPLDVDRALKKLDSIRDHIVWWETAAQSQQLLESGEVDMGLVWLGRAVDAGQSAPIEVAWGEWLSQDAFFMVPKGAENAKEAMKLIAFATSKAPQIRFAQLTAYGPVNREAAEDPAVAANENRPSNHIDTQVRLDDNWWAENLDKTTEVFQTWLLG